MNAPIFKLRYLPETREMAVTRDSIIIESHASFTKAYDRKNELKAAAAKAGGQVYVEMPVYRAKRRRVASIHEDDPAFFTPDNVWSSVSPLEY
jgi:hypothetical protein